MRVLVFILILTNLMFLAWAQGYLGAPSGPDALRVQQQLLADQVKVVARDEPPAEVIKADKSIKVEEKKAADVCLLLTDLPIAEVVRLENLLIEQLPAFKVLRTMREGSASFWVYIPPLATKQDADKKAAELKKLRVPEFFIVQDAGPNRFAISLGIFSSREAATERLEQLRAIGVKSARIGERTARLASATLEIRGPEAQSGVLRQSLAEVLPENKPEACKAMASSAQ